jgi:hypothetical protein
MYNLHKLVEYYSLLDVIVNYLYIVTKFQYFFAS